MKNIPFFLSMGIPLGGLATTLKNGRHGRQRTDRK